MEDKLIDDEARLAAARRLNIFDTPRERAFDHITKLVKMSLRVPVSAVSLIDEDRQWFKSIQGFDVTETTLERSFCVVSIRHRQPTVVTDALSDPRFCNNPVVVGEPCVRSYAGAPLILPDGYQVGTLCAVGFEPRTFSHEELSVLTELAGCVVREMELRERAAIDEMTGFMSRAPFLKRLEAVLDHYRGRGTGAVLSILDLDHFKAINDSFGHPVGDRVLQAVAQTCRDVLGETAQFGRLGGEEFALMIADADLHGAVARFDALRRAIAAIRFDDLPQLRVNASFGVAALNPVVSTVPIWCKLADTALYSAKQSGRNRVMIAGATDAATLAATGRTLPFADQVDERRLAALTEEIMAGPAY